MKLTKDSVIVKWAKQLVPRSLLKRQALDDGANGLPVRYHVGDLADRDLNFYLKYWKAAFGKQQPKMAPIFGKGPKNE